MNESIDSLLIGVIAAAAVTYLGFKIKQDRARLRRIVRIVDNDHSFDLGYLYRLTTTGELAIYEPPIPSVS